ncbi:hypothetical protein CLU79DRAFT_167895 [Phycomyces nitens]|nr:hypothetical protein CLU79DRAFT_167895 [Phycomyces nitens]
MTTLLDPVGRYESEEYDLVEREDLIGNALEMAQNTDFFLNQPKASIVYRMPLPGNPVEFRVMFLGNMTATHKHILQSKLCEMAVESYRTQQMPLSLARESLYQAMTHMDECGRQAYCQDSGIHVIQVDMTWSKPADSLRHHYSSLDIDMFSPPDVHARIKDYLQQDWPQKSVYQTHQGIDLVVYLYGPLGDANHEQTEKDLEMLGLVQNMNIPILGLIESDDTTTRPKETFGSRTFVPEAPTFASQAPLPSPDLMCLDEFSLLQKDSLRDLHHTLVQKPKRTSKCAVLSGYVTYTSAVIALGITLAITLYTSFFWPTIPSAELLPIPNAPDSNSLRYLVYAKMRSSMTATQPVQLTFLPLCGSLVCAPISPFSA